MKTKRKTVFVSGCFDMLHSGHVAFLTEAASYGDLTVGIGSDATVHGLKGRYPVNTQDERKYMLEALRCVHACVVNTGAGHIDFEEELRSLRPDCFVVTRTEILRRRSDSAGNWGYGTSCSGGFRTRTSPALDHTLRTECTIPYRIDLAGGWLDQPYVGKHCAGPC